MEEKWQKPLSWDTANKAEETVSLVESSKGVTRTTPDWWPDAVDNCSARLNREGPIRPLLIQPILAQNNRRKPNLQSITINIEIGTFRKPAMPIAEHFSYAIFWYPHISEAMCLQHKTLIVP